MTASRDTARRLRLDRIPETARPVGMYGLAATKAWSTAVPVASDA